MSDFIINETDKEIEFERDGCRIKLRIEDNNDVSVGYFFCDGYRGDGKGKILMLDSLIHLQTKDSSFKNISIWPVASLNFKKMEPLTKEAGFNFQQYQDEQQQKLVRYYKSLGFTGNGDVLYGNISNIIQTISASTGGAKKNKKYKTKKYKRNIPRKSKRNKKSK
jgi:hypothetical protein